LNCFFFVLVWENKSIADGAVGRVLFLQYNKCSLIVLVFNTKLSTLLWHVRAPQVFNDRLMYVFKITHGNDKIVKMWE
jgi:hypothetical protein